MRTKLLPDTALDRLKRHTWAYQQARRLRMAMGRVVPPRRFEGIDGRVHFNDFMLEDDSPKGVEAYRTRALNVIKLIDRSLETAGRDIGDIRSWLDFGCGYGRVLRFLVQRVDPDRVYASDVIEEAVDFCAAEFGVHPRHSTAALEDLDLGRFEFLYAISVLTHLDEKNETEMMRFLHRSLEPGGIALFTTHGQWSLDNLDFYGAIYEDMRDELASRVRERGVAFVPYHHYADDRYGMTWHSAEYVQRRMDELHGGSMRLLFFEPHGLDHHQDVFAYQRVV
jgi:SAM-dependent methyltransferase